MHTCIISGFGRIPIMKNKLLLTASLSGIACLSVIMAGSLLSKNQTFSAVRSTESEYTVTFNKDTLAPFSGLSYRGSDGYRSPKVVYAQLQNPGNYAGLRDYSYYSTPIYGGNHLYQREIRDSGVKIAFKVDLHYLNANPYYYDSARTQKIYTAFLHIYRYYACTLRRINKYRNTVFMCKRRQSLNRQSYPPYI